MQTWLTDLLSDIHKMIYEIWVILQWYYTNYTKVYTGIEKSGYIADILEKYRISGGTETIIVTDYRSTKKSAKSSIYRRNIGASPINRRKIASEGTRGEAGGGAQKIGD